MKKQIALWLLLLTLLPLCLTGCAGTAADRNAVAAPSATVTPSYRNAIERYTQLLTEYEWILVATSTIFAEDRFDSIINLTDPRFTITGDGSGNVHLLYTNKYGNAHLLGIVSFTADEQTMIVIDDSYIPCVYTRK